MTDKKINKIIGAKNLIEIIEDDRLLTSIINEKSRHLFEHDINAYLIMVYDELANFVIDLKINQTTKMTSRLNNAINKYVNAIYASFTANELIALFNPLFAPANIDNFLPEFHAIYIKNKQTELSHQARKISADFLNRKMVTEQELDFAAFFYTTEFGKKGFNSDNRDDFIDKCMLYSASELSTPIKYLILTSALEEKCKMNKVPLPKFYLSDYEFNGGPILGNAFYYKNSIVVSNKLMAQQNNFMGIPALEFLLFVVAHEGVHYLQDTDIKKGVLTPASMSMIISNILREYNSNQYFDEYIANYFANEAENEANINGTNFVIDYLRRHAIAKYYQERNILYKESINYKCSSAVATKKNSNDISHMADYYNYNELNEIVKNEPNLLERYPQLKIFFDYNKPKDFISLVRTKELLNSKGIAMRELDKIFGERMNITFYFDKNVEYAFAQLDIATQTLIFLEISKLINKEITSIEDFLMVYDKKNFTAREIVQERIRRLEKLLTFVKTAPVKNLLRTDTMQGSPRGIRVILSNLDAIFNEFIANIDVYYDALKNNSSYLLLLEYAEKVSNDYGNLRKM